MNLHRMGRALRTVVLSGVVGIACAPGERPPEAPVHGSLVPGARTRAAPSEEPFRVVFAAPQGRAASSSELSVVFSRPLRALDVAGTDGAPGIVVSPPILGRWQWVGARALRFVPESSRLPGAHRFTVDVPAETRSLDGATLGASYHFEFETPRPSVVRTTPFAGQEGLGLDTRFELELSQPITPEGFEAHVSLVAERGGARQRLPFVVSRPDPKLPKKMLVRPKGPLPKDSAIRLEVGEGLVGEEGPLAALPTSLSYRTYGPLTVVRIDCDTDTPHGGCAPASPVGFSLSNPVKLKDLRRAVSITPDVKVRVGGGDDEDFTAYVDLSGPLAAGTTYSLALDGALTDKYGQALGAKTVRQIRIDDYFPRVEIGIEGETLPSLAVREVPIGSINVGTYALVTAPLMPSDVPSFLGTTDPEARLLALERLPQAKKRTVAPPAQKNQVSKSGVAIAEALGKSRGVLGLGVRFSRDRRDYRSTDPVRVLKVTDLAISAKVSRHGSLVWVTRLSSGQPVARAEIELERAGKAAKHYETDGDGFARIPEADFAPDLYAEKGDAQAVLVARSGEDWTYERVADHLPEWRMPVPMDLSGAEHAYGLLFTERGVYRPGDTVRVKGIVRREIPTGNATPRGEKLELELRSPDDEVVSKTPVTTSRFGTFAAEVLVPLSGRLGRWQLRATGLGDDTLYEGFDVLEYRPSEFKVEAEAEKPTYVRGDVARLSVRADYLFGAPMSGAGLRYSLSRGRGFFEVPGLSGFVTDANAYWDGREEAPLSAGELASAEVRLDASGSFAARPKLELPGQRGPEVVRLDAEVTDVSRQSIASSTSVTVHPAEFYVGLSVPEDVFVGAPSDLAPRVVAATPEGKRLPGKKVRLELVQRRWTLAREALPGGGTHAVSRLVDRPAGACDVTTADVPVSCSLHVDAGGYYLVVAHAKDARGNSAEAAYGIYATGGAPTTWGDNDRAQVELVPNKKQYHVGERAKILVKMPFPEADALVTVERSGVYEARRMTLSGSSPTVEIPVTSALGPNAFVAVHLVRASRGKVQGPLYRVGYTELVVDREARRLRVSVSPSKQKLLPGEEVTVDLAVSSRDGKGAPAEVTVYAVDEGVLMLTGYRTPDPLPVFTSPRPLQVATIEGRESLAKISLDTFQASLGSEKGAEGGGGGGGGARRDFRQTAYFNPGVVTDEHGRASVRFRLPESLTTYRVMAVATTEADQYGFGSASVTTSRRLMARPNLPRFLRAGDHAEAAVIVTSKGLAASKVVVRASVKGLLLETGAERTVDLPKDASVEVAFPLRAEVAGSAEIRFDVAAGAEQDAVVVSRRVEAPGAVETVALYGQTDRASAEKIGDLSTLRRDTGRLEVTLSSSALVGLDGGAAQLVEYPYACTEQLSSRILPLVPLRELSRAFGFPLPRDAAAIVDRAVGEILSRQTGDGGFGMWPGAEASTPWVSAYAVWVLDQAARAGTTVSESARKRAHDFLRRSLAAGDTTPERLATNAFVVDVLAEGGAPDPGYMSRLFEVRDKLPLFARAFLLHALAVGKGPPAAVAELRTVVEAGVRVAHDEAFAAENVGDEYAALFDSTARTSALVLRALVAADPRHPLAPALARGLLAVRRGGTWRTTQETAYALVALDAYRRARESRPAAFSAKAWMGERVLSRASFGGELTAEHTVVPLRELFGGGASTLVFEKQGTGTLFYDARLEYVRAELPRAPLDEGFFVQKALRVVRPEALGKALATVETTGTTRFAAGDLVVADLVVVTPSPREWVVVDDPLPAGFEGVDTNLATTAAWLDVADSTASADEEPACDGCEPGRDALAHGRAFIAVPHRREVRDDRTLFFVDHLPAGMYHFRYLARATTRGTFVTPPLSAQEMYTPETFGRTPAFQVVVQ